MTSRRRCRWLATSLLLYALAIGDVNAWGQSVRFEEVGTIAGPVDLIRAQSNYVFTSAFKTLAVFDVSNPTSARRTGEYTFPDRILGFRPSGKLVYVAANLFGLAILEVSDTGTLTLRGSLKTPGSAKNVAISEHTAIVADQVAGLDFVDISDPGKPVPIGSLYLDGFASDVATAGSFAYAVDRPNGFYVVDVTKPKSEDPISSVRSSASVNGQMQVEVVLDNSGRPATAVRVLGPLLLYDVSDPAKPIERGPFRTPGRPQRVSVQGMTLYVADGPGGLQVIDLSDPLIPQIAGSYKTSNPAMDVAVSGELVFVVARGTGVIVLRQSR